MLKKPKKAPPKPSGHSTVDVALLLDQIEFSPENVVQATAVNSVLFKQSLDYRLERMLEKSRVDMNNKRVRAETELSIREKAKQRGEKITESHISSLLIIHPLIVTSDDELENAKTYDEYSKLVVEAFRMRRDCLKIVAEVMRTEFSIGRSAELESEALGEIRRNLKTKYPKE